MVFRSSLIATAFLALLLVLVVPLPALAADPSPTPTPGGSRLLIDPLDPRAGEGASRVGAPLFALVVVLGLGVTAAAGTFAYTRLTRRR